MPTLIGPFAQLLPLTDLPLSGPINDRSLSYIEDAGILVHEGRILKIGSHKELRSEAESFEEFDQPLVALPGLIDCHTHICYGGSRAADYARRLSGMSYQDILALGGGILDTVKHTREASCESLTASLCSRLRHMRSWGITTCEVKSGYGLSVEDELKMLQAINDAMDAQWEISLVPTCLAAHCCPPEYSSPEDYLKTLSKQLLPQVKRERLAKRVDIFIEKGAFSPTQAENYLYTAYELGFDLTVHADQFSKGGSAVAAKCQALSADHLEQSTEEEMQALKLAEVIPVVLPGATLGLGMPFAPARRLLDHGLPLAIASDWNPGSAPMGNLLAQASLLAAAEKLSTAETFAGLTFRAAAALGLEEDRGILAPQKRADLALFPTKDYRDILYYQGELRAQHTYNAGRRTTDD